MPVPAVQDVAHISLQDHAGKISHAEWVVSPTDAAAYIADYSTGAIRTLIDDFMALTLDNKISEEVTIRHYRVIAPAPFPSDENAVNSAKLMVLGRDTVTGDPFKQEIPARNGANYTSARGEVDLAGTDVAAYVAASNATKLSADGNATGIVSIKVIGKGTQA